MVISMVPRKPVSMQEMVGGDYNRTPVFFQVSDNLVFVGEIKRIRNDPCVVIASRKISNKYTQSLFLGFCHI